MQKHQQSPYLVEALADQDGQPVLWAKCIYHPKVEAKGNRMGMRYRGATDYNDASGGYLSRCRPDKHAALAFLSCEQASGQIIGEYIAGKHAVPKNREVVIVYPPDSGLPFAKGLAKAFEQQGRPARIFAADDPDARASHAETRSGKRVRHRQISHVEIPADALACIQRGGLVVLCDGSINTGDTLHKLLSQVPADFSGEVIVAAHHHNIMRDASAPDRPLEGNWVVKQLQQYHKKTSVYPPAWGPRSYYYVAALNHESEIDPVDVGDTIKDVQESAKRGKWWLGAHLKKRAVAPEAIGIS